MIVNILKLGGGMIMGADKASIKFISALKEGVYSFECLTEVPKKARRSNLQNRYYWGCVLAEIVRDTDDSYSADQIHEMLKGAYFGHNAIGKSYVIAGDTKTLNTVEMEDYLKACREWAWENLSLSIQLPNEAGFNY